MHATETETHKAKKQHRCGWCWQFVDAGETYKRYRYYNCGDAGTVKMHPECYDVMQEEAREEGGWFEWTPGQERPAPSNAEVSGCLRTPMPEDAPRTAAGSPLDRPVGPVAGA